jgi:hypothetical protein
MPVLPRDWVSNVLNIEVLVWVMAGQVSFSNMENGRNRVFLEGLYDLYKL